VKGLIFGSLFGVLWSLAFLSAAVFPQSSLTAELLNGLIDVIPPALAGVLAELSCWMSMLTGFPSISIAYVLSGSFTTTATGSRLAVRWWP